MDASKFASTFAPYTPPPDDPAVQRSTVNSKPSRFSRAKGPWFSSSADSPRIEPSYQSGAVPSFGNHVTNVIDSEEGGNAGQLWETRYNWRVDMCAASTYLLGPITAYQAALFTTPLWLIRIIASFIFPSWLQTLLTVLIILAQIGMADVTDSLRAYRDASLSGLARYQLPYVGEIADRWVIEE
ncbi:hypothetical protein Clacol_003899 [Clathrus columnatus]|uniref:Uncharacterized protein n=1 Tax=Clathrus columnatus TaxID=1419009 RepID=A0AAV5A5V5_9AGAM|nr:hypothetical protein Clacol_003899 [Clathrus columnatus]